MATPLDYKLILERSPIALLILSPHLTIVGASDLYVSKTLTVRDEIVGRHLFDVFPDDPDDPDATGVETLRASLRRVLADRRPDTMAVQKYDIFDPDAEGGRFVERYWSPINSPVLDDSGELRFIVHQVVDVTDFVRHRLADIASRQGADARAAEMEKEIFLRAQEIQRANILLRASEERFRLLSRATSEGIWEWDLVTDALWVSDSFENLLGRSPSEIVSVEVWKGLIHPDDRRRVLSEREHAISSGADGWAIEHRMVHRSGSVVWVDCRATIIRGEGGQAERVVGGTRDLTVRKEAEIRIHRQAQLLDKASDAIIVRDLDDYVTYWNAGAERLYGWTTGDTLGRVDPTLTSQYAERFAAAKESTLLNGDWHGELGRRTKGGAEILIEARWTLLRDDRGEPEAILAINTDITERRRLEAHYLRSQRLDSIGTLAGGIAHDLNNVLTPILFAAELLRDEVASEDGARWLDLLDGSARRGLNMVNQVLTFARGAETEREVLDVTEVAYDLVRLISDSFPKSIRISYQASDSPQLVTGDATQLQQVLLNLCVNARDAMPAGGDLSISVDSLRVDEQLATMMLDAAPGNYVVIRVSDSGIGISPDDMERIFDPFFTTKEVGQGTGLGLATAHTITRSHGGFLHAESAPGRGSTFTVYLPASTGVEHMSMKSHTLRQSMVGGETVLIVEDEPAVMLVMQHTLETAGYRVLTASDGAEGIAVYALHRTEIDLVVTDMMMPVMDGTALMAALVKIDPDVRILAASGLPAHPGTPAMADALAKPFTSHALLTAVRRRLDDERPTT